MKITSFLPKKNKRKFIIGYDDKRDKEYIFYTLDKQSEFIDTILWVTAGSLAVNLGMMLIVLKVCG